MCSNTFTKSYLHTIFISPVIIDGVCLSDWTVSQPAPRWTPLPEAGWGKPSAPKMWCAKDRIHSKHVEPKYSIVMYRVGCHVWWKKTYLMVAHAQNVSRYWKMDENGLPARWFLLPGLGMAILSTWDIRYTLIKILNNPTNMLLARHQD